MNDEINRIIQSISDFYKLDNALKYYLDRHKAQIILDYITNLQQENESLRTRIKTIKRLRKKQTQKKNKYKSIIFDEEQKLKDYKYRCKKAIEMLKEIHKILPGTYNQLLIEITQTLNILQNGSDEE